MNLNMHGKKIRRFVTGVDCNENSFTTYSYFEGKAFLKDPEFVLYAGNHGNWDDFWILAIVDDVEVARWNTRYVAHIDWEK